MSTAPPERPFRLVVNVPVALAQQYDALAVARGITRAKLVNAALDLALPQMRVADLDNLPYDPRSRRGPRSLHARKGTPAHTLIQVRDLAVPYVKNRPGLEPPRQEKAHPRQCGAGPVCAVSICMLGGVSPRARGGRCARLPAAPVPGRIAALPR